MGSKSAQAMQRLSCCTAASPSPVASSTLKWMKAVLMLPGSVFSAMAT